MRVLIVKVSSLGDIIHTLPAVTDAHRAHKDLVFDWVVEENFVEVPAWHPAVDQVIPVAIRRWRKNLVKTYMRKEFRSFKNALQTEHYDLVIDAQGLIKSGVISRLSRGLTIGLSNRTIREPLATLFYNKVYSVPWSEHAVDRVRQLFSRALKHHYDKDEVDYGLDTSQFDNGQSDNEEPDRNEKSVVFLHGTTWVTKHWPEYYWRHLAHLAGEAGYKVYLPWGDDSEKQRAEFIARGSDNAEVLGKLSLSGMARVINQSTGVVAVDTGLGHLAAALSKPTVSLYGATDPALSGTYGNRQLHLNSNLNCAPCVKKVCTYTGPGITDEFEDQPFAVTPPCFSSHRPESVWQQLEQLIQN
ncbi:MAG: lipopolysaccharide heptosyltransferase I [Gammaproteobacteria bacterium]